MMSIFYDRDQRRFTHDNILIKSIVFSSNYFHHIFVENQLSIHGVRHMSFKNGSLEVNG